MVGMFSGDGRKLMMVFSSGCMFLFLNEELYRIGVSWFESVAVWIVVMRCFFGIFCFLRIILMSLLLKCEILLSRCLCVVVVVLSSLFGMFLIEMFLLSLLL